MGYKGVEWAFGADKKEKILEDMSRWVVEGSERTVIRWQGNRRN